MARRQFEKQKNKDTVRVYGYKSFQERLLIGSSKVTIWNKNYPPNLYSRRIILELYRFLCASEREILGEFRLKCPAKMNLPKSLANLNHSVMFSSLKVLLVDSGKEQYGYETTYLELSCKGAQQYSRSPT